MTTEEKSQASAIFPLTHGKHEAPSLELARLAVERHDPNVIESCAVERAFVLKAIREGWAPERLVAEWTDNLPCGDPVLNVAYQQYNDRVGRTALGNARRMRTFPVELLEALIGTKGSKKLSQRRAYALADWSIRDATPRLLDRSTTLTEWASKLRKLAPIVDEASLNAARSTCLAMRDDAWRAYNAVYADLRKAAEAEAVAAVAVAVEAVAAVAVAVAAEAAAAVAAVAEAVAVAAVAVAVAAEAAAVFTPAIYQEAAKAARLAGNSWSRQYAAAREVFDRALADGASKLPASHVSLRDELDAEFSALLMRLCKMTDGDAVAS